MVEFGANYVIGRLRNRPCLGMRAEGQKIWTDYKGFVQKLEAMTEGHLVVYQSSGVALKGPGIGLVVILASVVDWGCWLGPM